MTLATDPFIDTVRHRRRRRVVDSAQTLALGAAVIAAFAWATSLDILRNAALLAGLLPLGPLALGLVWRGGQADFDRPLLRGAAATLGALGLVWVCFALTGLGLGFERRITELPAARVRVADIDARRHPEQATILALLDAARAAPSLATLRPLVPLMRQQHQFITDAEGQSQPVSVAARTVMMAKRSLLLRSLDEEVLAMAALLPLDGPAPPLVEVDVAGRMRAALGLLLELQVEQRMQGRFELPSVGLVLDTVVPDETHGAREVRHEVGLTYPFAEFAAREDALIDYATVRAVLDMIREDLRY